MNSGFNPHCHWKDCCYPTETLLSITKQELEKESVHKFVTAEDTVNVMHKTVNGEFDSHCHWKDCCYPTETVLSITKQELEKESFHKFVTAEDPVNVMHKTVNGEFDSRCRWAVCPEAVASWASSSQTTGPVF